VARPVGSNCPQCGAALDVDPQSEVATCRYCGHRSLIESEGRERAIALQVQQGDPGPSVRQIAVRSPPSSGVLVAVVIIMALISLAIGAVVIGATKTTGRTPIRPTTASLAIANTTVANTIKVADARQVDIAEVVRQARTVAIAQEPHVDRLSSVVAFNVTNGVLDTTQQNAASIDFSFRYKDPTKPPGQKDVVEGSVSVHATGGGLQPRTMNAFYRDKALNDPKCSSRDAWAAAVKSGVPANAVATFHLYDNAAFSPASPTVWSIRVEGHDEYRREIDAMTCSMVKNWSDPGKKVKR
jgi:DNA-directed RNA polymerase subunit RPC12/RpoP